MNTRMHSVLLTVAFSAFGAQATDIVVTWPDGHETRGLD